VFMFTKLACLAANLVGMYLTRSSIKSVCRCCSFLYSIPCALNRSNTILRYSQALGAHGFVSSDMHGVGVKFNQPHELVELFPRQLVAAGPPILLSYRRHHVLQFVRMFNDVNDVVSDGQCNRLPVRTVSKHVGELVGRPGKRGGSWDPRSKKISGVQENFQPKSRTFVENQVFVANPALLEL